LFSYKLFSYKLFSYKLFSYLHDCSSCEKNTHDVSSNRFPLILGMDSVGNKESFPTWRLVACGHSWTLKFTWHVVCGRTGRVNWL
jgi:hypothetical protein